MMVQYTLCLRTSMHACFMCVPHKESLESVKESFALMLVLTMFFFYYLGDICQS